MAIFGRRTARQRLRRATRESLTVPAFSSPVDCTPWVTGGLWPVELSTLTGETATLATYLKVDLERIAGSANDKLRSIRQAGMVGSARQAEEARVIDEARAVAVRRVESTIRQLRELTQNEPSEEPGAAAAGHSNHDVEPGPTGPPAGLTVEKESGGERLRRLSGFVARQEPRLNWAVGEHPDGTTVLVTDLAHGWIPPDIELPEGVRLLEPGRRAGKVSALVGDATCSVVYSPGDSLGWSTDPAATKSSAQPRVLPAINDLGRQLDQATHRRDGLPRTVHTLARAAAAGTRVIDDEIDLLRVHLDTARHQMLVQYPDVEHWLLLNSMLLAATERSVTGDLISANYHLAWFQKLNSRPESE